MKEVYLEGVTKSIEYPIGLMLSYNLPIIEKMAETILSLNENRILLCCSGNSGSLVAGIISPHLIKEGVNCVISYIRKEHENRHMSSDFSGNHESFFSIMVDDFIATGDTLIRINDRYKKAYRRNIDCICTSTYNTKKLPFKPKVNICILDPYKD